MVTAAHSAVVALQTGIGPIDALVALLAGVVGFVLTILPSVLFAAVVLAGGYLLADRVDEWLYERTLDTSMDEKAAETPAGAVIEDDDGVATAVGRSARYLVLVVAVVVALRALDVAELQELLDATIGYVPNVVAAAVLLVVGLGVGRVVRSLVPGVVDRTAVGEAFPETHLGRALDAATDTVGSLAGLVAEYYVYLVTLYVVTATLEVGSAAGLLGRAVTYAPVLVGALVLVLFGSIVADYAGSAVTAIDAVADSPFEGVAAGGVQAIVYLFTVVIALDVAGVDSTLLGLLLIAAVLPVGLALALAAGLSVGYGGQEYVEGYLADER